MAAPLYLVTGAAGFVGRHPVKHLAKQKVWVRAMVHKPKQAAMLEILAPLLAGVPAPWLHILSRLVMALAHSTEAVCKPLKMRIETPAAAGGLIKQDGNK
ncbi:NAD-dependent epimerase/dehydratase family protein [Leisingera sp. NJS201]|uniref:NAD-dependent epimerase/dehydratase family protein n=1 Tax=Leisingera sp. NJS201 TaxID=2508306 RepID=UPI001431D33E|nr:NAD-dependent epimerase/dehydratase family protein [Leisingera sp. NJS201]